MRDKLEDIENRRDRRIDFSYKGKAYSINITNEDELRLSVTDGIVIVKPIACNCIIFDNEKG